jgi:murein DD-endopeptidase MepM/ murein hydrolase activator NlpD
MRAALLIIMALTVGGPYLAGGGFDTTLFRRFWPELATPFRVAQMVARPADTTLLMPVAGVSAARVDDTWHANRPGGRRHEGQDIFATRGTPVRSATNGVVVRIGQNGLGGNIVSVMGAGGRIYYYAHLERPADTIAVGDIVSAGTVLGYVGNTGNARTTPPHLHFGVYGSSGPLNPLPLLAAGD